MTPTAYIQQIKDHRARMAKLGLFYCILNDDAGEATRTACRIHDAEKWPFLPLLFAFHGGRGNRKIARVVYNALNATGAVIQAVALAPYPPKDRATARTMERVFDRLDRSLDPVARIELGDATDPPPLSKFLSPDELVIAESWADRWRRLFQHRSQP